MFRIPINFLLDVSMEDYDEGATAVLSSKQGRPKHRHKKSNKKHVMKEVRIVYYDVASCGLSQVMTCNIALLLKLRMLRSHETCSPHLLYAIIYNPPGSIK